MKKFDEFMNENIDVRTFFHTLLTPIKDYLNKKYDLKVNEIFVYEDTDYTKDNIRIVKIGVKMLKVNTYTLEDIQTLIQTQKEQTNFYESMIDFSNYINSYDMINSPEMSKNMGVNIKIEFDNFINNKFIKSLSTIGKFDL